MNSVVLKKILDAGVNQNYYTNVLPCDQLYHVKSNQFAIIVNSDKAKDPGQHWLAIFKEYDSDNIEFFDSCNMPLSFYDKSIKNFLELHSKNIVRNQKRYQSAFSATCGEFCIYYLVHRVNGYRFIDLMNGFNRVDLTKNDDMVKQFIRENFGMNFSKGHEESTTLAEVRRIVEVVQCCVILSKLIP